MNRNIKVDIIGAINDRKLKAEVTGYIEDTTGVGQLTFEYSEVPPAPEWHPLNYSDPLVLLPGYQGVRGAPTFATLAPPGSFTAECTFDFGNGLLLRKGATIKVETDSNGGVVHTGGYFITGTARCGHIADVLGKKHGPAYAYEYREFMHPAGNGKVIGIGAATWPLPGGGTIEAVVSARYQFTGPGAASTAALPGHYVRVLEVTDATWAANKKTVTAVFKAGVEPL